VISSYGTFLKLLCRKIPFSTGFSLREAYLAIEKSLLPAWALRPIGVNDLAAAVAARDKDVLYSNYDRLHNPRQWAKSQGWPTGWLGRSYTEQDFAKTMLDRQDNYSLALAASGIELYVPVDRHAITQQELDEADASYESGNFRWLVDFLRTVRRAVELGVVVEVDDNQLDTFASFYTWAHGRYYALEDDTNTAWIGDDSKHPY
jgi:hypothetical protein